MLYGRICVWSAKSTLRVLYFQESDGQVENLLLANIAGLVSFDAEPLHSARFVGQSELSFAATFQLQALVAFSELHKAYSANCFFLWNVLTGGLFAGFTRERQKKKTRVVMKRVLVSFL